MEPNKTIDVLIPGYNCEKTIRRTLEALKNQTYDQSLIKILFYDDGSTDNSIEEVKKLKDELNLNITIYEGKVNKGHGTAIYELLQHIESDYFVFNDADDDYLPSAFTTYLESNDDDYDIISFKYNFVDDNVNFTPDRVKERSTTINQRYDIMTNTGFGLMYHNRLYKTSFIKQFDFSYMKDQRTWVDAVYTSIILAFCDNKTIKTKVVDKVTYIYHGVMGSVSNVPFDDRKYMALLNALKVLVLLYEKCKKEQFKSIIARYAGNYAQKIPGFFNNNSRRKEL